MLLDDLVDLVETLKARMQKHGHSLRESETRTRMVLVDPLLCALGWDTRNPELVEAEYPVRRGRVDYALLGDGTTPVAVVEAKRLGEPLDEHLNQMLSYANELGIPKAAITDGNRWQLYEVFKQAPIQERVILRVRVADEQPVQCAMRLLALWRRSLSEQNRVPPDLDEETQPQPSPPSRDQQKTHLTGTPLPRLDLKSKGNPKPHRIHFPDSHSSDVNSGWVAVLVAVAEWLVVGNRVRSRPLRSDRGTVLLNTMPTNSKGKALSTPKQVGDLYVEGNVSAQLAVNRSIEMLRLCDVDPSEVRVEC